MTTLLAQIRNPVLPNDIGGAAQPSMAQGGTAVGGFVSAIVGGMIIIAFIMSLLYLLTGGFMWITSGGDKTNLESARNKIIHAIVGFIVIAAVWAIMTLVGQFVGLDFKKLPIPSVSSPDSTQTTTGGSSNRVK